MRIIASLGLLATTILLTPNLAAADTSGSKGRVVELVVNEPTSDDYGSFRGSVKLAGGKSFEIYHWGGSFCPGKDLSAESVDRLTNAFLTRRSTKVVPHYKNGQGGNKCLVGYELEGKSNDGPG